ncbi:tetratricopeptide repeat protein [Sulfurospirillum oryzae]|uniref:tetratricopeptide repeat protein n=1 Tax=Sulfurospirillum oryzae TaxID=2976535 RepID=UPI0021E7CDF4|nr:tetratricopeptide repeat protein [Sulfurospirillum oryzae]
MAALSSEPSAFGGSDVSSGSSTTSYSNTVTVSDKKYFPNNQKSASNDNNSINKAELSNVSEQYEGMRSVMDSYASKIAKQDDKMRQLEEENKKLREYVEENRKIQADNQEKIKVVVGELGSLIDSINKNYVPKDKFDQLANEVRGGKGATSKTIATASEPAKKDAVKEIPSAAPAKTISAKELSTKDSATLLKEADDHFDKKSYADAQALYTELLNRNYKPAKINFNLGEIAYSQKSYSTAIEHYKSSIALFDKAAYTPTLLYHTGASFEKLGKTKEAQGFYKALKDSYPDSPEAKKVK